MQIRSKSVHGRASVPFSTRMYGARAGLLGSMGVCPMASHAQLGGIEVWLGHGEKAINSGTG